MAARRSTSNNGFFLSNGIVSDTSSLSNARWFPMRAIARFSVIAISVILSQLSAGTAQAQQINAPTGTPNWTVGAQASVSFNWTGGCVWYRITTIEIGTGDTLNLFTGGATSSNPVIYNYIVPPTSGGSGSTKPCRIDVVYRPTMGPDVTMSTYVNIVTP